MSKRKPPVLDALGKLQGVRRFTDANLEHLHDLALVALVRCQCEMQKRGIPSIALVQRSEGVSLLATDPGKPPLCRCIAAALDPTSVEKAL